MVEGHTIDNDGKLWRLTLRAGMKFHDNTPVLARDAVASVKRWGAHDAFGQALLAATDELSADGDRVIVFRLKRPFPLLPAALSKLPAYMPCIMPERLATLDIGKQLPELVGSGPFRFVPEERVQGARFVYARFPGYVPRTDPVSRTAATKPLMSTGWSGPSSPMPPRPPPPSKTAKRIGGRARPPTCCPC